MAEINFVEIDAQAIENKMINDFEGTLKETLYPADERRIFLLQENQVVVGLKNDINETGRQNLLRYAKGPLLDALGERLDTPRLQSQKSTVTFRFTLSEIRDVDTPISAGKRGTPDGSLYFATKEDFIIPAGQLYGDKTAEAVEAGSAYNGFTPGQIKNLADPIPYVASITNIDTSSGGTDIEPDDDGINIWSGYRERLREAPAKLSTAGPDDSYIFWAKTVSSDIIDVVPTSPSPGVVKITVLMKGGELPTQPILDAVYAAVSPKNRRPLTDNVQTAAPTEELYDIDLIYYISKNRKTEEPAIMEAIESVEVGSEGAIEQYKVWQSAKLGREINPDYLRQLMLNAGAYRIDITSPVFTAIDEDAKAKVVMVTVTYGGLI